MTPHTDERIPALDGLRGLAVLLVVMQNAGSVHGPLTGAPLHVWALVSNTGWIGVQLFFALSGFLITRILLRTRGAPHYYRNFYARRVLRIFPLYCLLLVVVVVIAPHVAALASLATGATRTSMWDWIYLSNWVVPFGGIAIGLSHIWSLSVEEQFYVLWPMLVARCGARAMLRICVLIIAIALVARIVLRMTLPEADADVASYSFTITRWDAIAFGAIVAIAVHHAAWRARLAAVCRVALPVLSGILVAVIVVDHGLLPDGRTAEWVNIPVSGALSAVIVALCVETAAAARTTGIGAVVSRVCSARAFRWIGRYSYAIYVFHLPIHLLAIGRFQARLAQGAPSTRFMMHVAYTTGVFAAATMLALVSWSVLEAPLLSLKSRFPAEGPADATPARTG